MCLLFQQIQVSYLQVKRLGMENLHKEYCVAVFDFEFQAELYRLWGYADDLRHKFCKRFHQSLMKKYNYPPLCDSEIKSTNTSE